MVFNETINQTTMIVTNQVTSSIIGGLILSIFIKTLIIVGCIIGFKRSEKEVFKFIFQGIGITSFLFTSFEIIRLLWVIGRLVLGLI